MRLVDETGTNVGVVTLEEARERAEKANLDLVEVAPNARPPVCRIMDYGKFSYERDKKEREARKNQKQVDIKTIQLRPGTADFHRDINVRKAERWLSKGKKVKVVFRFRSREIHYPEIAREGMERIIEDLSELAVVEQQPTMEGWSMTMMLAPNK